MLVVYTVESSCIDYGICKYKHSGIAIYIYVTGKLRNQAFREMPKIFSHFLK